TLGEADILLQGFRLLARHPAWALLRCFDVHRIPLGAELPGNPRAGAEHARRLRVRAHADHHALGNERRLETLACAVARGLLPDLFGHGTQGELAKRGEIAFPEKTREGLLDLFRLVD